MFEGHKQLILYKHVCLLNELNALLASTNKIAPVFSSSYILLIEWITALVSELKQ